MLSAFRLPPRSWRSCKSERKEKEKRCKIISSKGFFHGKTIEKTRVEVVGDE
jgi:hypothetical protein